MSYATQVASYREMEILSASPERLVVLLFDHLVIHLHRVQLAIEGNDVTLRTTSLGKARGIVSELLSTLDFEKGGRIAKDLQSLYGFLLGEMADVGLHRDARKVARLKMIAEELRIGFTGAAASVVPVKRPA
ncbi:MAG: flagellar export chaperone FliS [Phycisphaerae bacterium]|nr:flagellar export chaperone FliS [Gemmatimonadaceae bacterium]